MSLLAENCIVKDGCLPRRAEASWVSPKEGLCSAWPTAGALKSVFQQPGGTGRGRLLGTGRGGGCSPSRRAWLGGLLPEGPCGSPPQYKGGSSSRFKVELIQRGQPSHLETQKELELALGEEGQPRRSFPTGAFAPGSQASGGALPGTGCSPNPHHNGGKLNESS